MNPGLGVLGVLGDFFAAWRLKLTEDEATKDSFQRNHLT